MSLVLSIAAFLASLALLYIGSKKIVHAAACLADSLNFHRVVVGTVLVASVTSAPELLSSLVAALFSSSHMALGNLLGSNIYNVPLIVGICGLIGEYKLKNHSVNRECLLMVGLAFLLIVLILATGMVVWWIGLIFLAFYPAFVYYSVRKGNGNGCPKDKPRESPKKSAGFMVLGGAALICGTFLLVYSAMTMAEIFGLSQFYAGLAIMAIGCVVPETAVSVAAALHGEQEISIGNVIGDNIITMTLVFGIVGLIRPFKVSPSEILSTVPFIILVTFMLYVMSWRSRKITKKWGLLMLTIAAIAFIFETFYFTFP
ncbi:MAG: sodium:calcium antiporter [Candidatus Bathyarchaeales archaeon]